MTTKAEACLNETKIIFIFVFVYQELSQNLWSYVICFQTPVVFIFKKLM